MGAALYNQLFTTHGTMMMFLFAVQAMKAMGVYLLPAMLAARDLPFPRLSTHAFWAYAIGGLVFFSSIFYGAAPDGGWFMYPPLTSKEYSPGINADVRLLGIGFIAIPAVAGAGPHPRSPAPGGCSGHPGRAPAGVAQPERDPPRADAARHHRAGPRPRAGGPGRGGPRPRGARLTAAA